MGAFPRIVKEEGLLSDGERSLIGLPTSGELTATALLELNALLASPSLKAITSKATGFGRDYFPSSLGKRNGLASVESPTLPYEYAHDKGAFLLASLLDEKEDFLREDPRLGGLSQATAVPGFRSYDYRYTPFRPVPPEGTRSYSPTGLQAFYGCPFAYYLASVLKIEEEEVSFLPRIGVVFHAVMESLYRPGFDFEVSWGESKAAEGALLPRLKDECALAVAFYRSHEGMVQALAVSPEGRFALPAPERPQVVFAGQYDKIVTFGEGHPYFCVLDYKTGGERFHEELLNYGLSLQLPFYAYAALHDPAFAGKELVGLFIGPLLPSSLVKPENRTLEEFNASKFKLDGVFANDLTAMLALDPSAHQSTFIKGMAYGDKGFRNYASAFPRSKKPADFVAMADEASALTLQADERIRAGDFPVHPVKYKALYNACERCLFRDVCYRPEEAVTELSPRLNEEETEEGTDGEDVDE
jgi:ATP-dependent helicase/DNAse subunit B